MGTSSSYGGPVGKHPLLPPWADEPVDTPVDQNGDDVLQPFLEELPSDATQQAHPLTNISVLDDLIPWSNPKSALTRRARGNANVSWGTITRRYVQASGGPRRAAASSRAGRTATSRLGGFLANGLRNGFVEAARRLGVQNLIGRDAQYVLAAFIDLIAPDGALREEAIARKAVIETMAEWFERYEVDAAGIEVLDRMTPDGMRDLIVLSVTNYVNARFQQELLSRIELGTLSEHDANVLADEAKEFIASVVNIDVGSVDLVALNWDGPEGHQFIDGVYTAAYGLLAEAA